MATVVVVHPAGAADRVRLERDDPLVRERAEGDGRFGLAEGPYRRYERTLHPLPDGSIEEHTSFRLAGGWWSTLFVPGFRHAVRRRPARAPWWAPPARLDRRAADVLGLLCSLAVIAGYLGTLMTQTATFAADEFGATTSAQSAALASTRAGVLIAVVILAVADRLGRRRMAAVAAAAGCIVAATGALVPNLAGLALSQTVARGFATSLLLLIAIISAEEMPAGSRAYAYSLLVMVGALGAGMALWFIPVADSGLRAWRLLYVVPLVFLPVVRSVLRRLPETKRFERPHVEAPFAGHGRRFWLLASTSLLVAIFVTPANQLMNEFLRDERGFSAARVALFTTVTVTPGGLGVILGGRLADVRGRRQIAFVGITLGTVLTVLQFGTVGWLMWTWGLASSIPAGLAVPSYSVYRSELFPTSLRGRLGGIAEVLAVIGSAVGLLAVGALVDGGRSYGEAFAWVAAAPIAVAFIVLVLFPETAHRSLEEINPEDREAPAATR